MISQKDMVNQRGKVNAARFLSFFLRIFGDDIKALKADAFCADCSLSQALLFVIKAGTCF